jgi:protein O-mannosyl-transferase
VTRTTMIGGTAGLTRPVFLDIAGRDRVKRVALACGLTAAVLVYANAFVNGFVLDDRAVILDNPLVLSPGSAWRAFAMPYWPDAIGGGQYRPLGTLSFAFDWLVSGGDPRWFHAMNVVWHAVATILVWLLAAELLAPLAAGTAALLFAVHPVHVEAVSNVVGRLEPMAAVFVLAALIAHRRSHWSASICFGLALLSKESAIVFLALALSHDLVLEQDWRRVLRARRWLYASYACVVIGYALVLASVFHDRSFSNPARAFAGMTTGQRLELVTRVVPHYVRLLFAPTDLSASYAPNVISPRTGFSVSGALGVSTVVVLLVTLVTTLRRRRWPVMAFAVLWVPIALAPVSNIFFPSGVVLAERTLYLASVGFCLAAGAAAARLAQQRPAVITAATVAVVLAFAVRTWTRTPVWRDDRTYVLTLLADHPESYEAHLTAGRVLKGANAFEEADRELTIARRLFPRDSVVFREAADLADRQQRPVLAAALRDSAHIAHTLSLR